MNRTVFTKSDDGNLLITRESRMGTPGAAKDRRRRARFLERDHSYNPWVRKDRVIVRPGKPMSEQALQKAMNWPGVNQDGDRAEIEAIAATNNCVAALYAGLAEQTVFEINEAIEAFEVPPTPEVKVLLTYAGVPEAIFRYDLSAIERSVLGEAIDAGYAGKTKKERFVEMYGGTVTGRLQK